MNCANHSDRPVSAYCQNCGKALCASCVRQVSGQVYCEQCLAERLGVGSGAVGVAPPIAGVPNPALATVLGFIPGVGAMYNGQYVKAIVHVLVFVVLVGIANQHGIFGIFIGAWVLYQVFDAHHTARSRKFGLPVPDPFGLNDLGNRIGLHNAAPYVPPAGVDPLTGQPVAGAPPYGYPPGEGFGTGPSVNPGAAGAPGSAPYAGDVAGQPPPYGTYVPVDPMNPMHPMAPPPDLRYARREPIGAIVLIGLGMLFLFNTLGIFRFDWIGHGWPLIIIGVGIWLVIARARSHANPTGSAR